MHRLDLPDLEVKHRALLWRRAARLLLAADYSVAEIALVLTVPEAFVTGTLLSRPSGSVLQAAEDYQADWFTAQAEPAQDGAEAPSDETQPSQELTGPVEAPRAQKRPGTRADPDRDAQILELHRQGVHNAEIARRVGMTRPGVAFALHRLCRQ